MRYFLFALLSLAVASSFTEAQQLLMRPPAISTRVAMADLVVIGKVTGFADKLEAVELYPGAKAKAEYKVATVRVDDLIQGDKGLKEIRVGSVMAVVPTRPGGTRGRFNLTIGREALLFLVKHPTADFYVGQAYYDAIAKTATPEFDKEMAEARRCVKLLADPKTSLASKDADERLLTASMLVSRYRPLRSSATPPKEEAIDADISKRIMTILADASWDNKPTPDGGVITPRLIFAQLGMTPADGWTPPMDISKFEEEAKKWILANVDKFRIKRFVY